MSNTVWTPEKGWHDGPEVRVEDLNIWGTPKADVGEGYCRDCEREGGKHYDSCPQSALMQSASTSTSYREALTVLTDAVSEMDAAMAVLAAMVGAVEIPESEVL